jgi:hypothetical protein
VKEKENEQILTQMTMTSAISDKGRIHECMTRGWVQGKVEQNEKVEL